jgi:ABC-type maltose transport system permease subunit
MRNRSPSLHSHCLGLTNLKSQAPIVAWLFFWPRRATPSLWNDFFFPLVLITSDNLKTLPQGLTVFVGEFTTDWGVLFTGLTLAALPITLLYIVLSKQFISGIAQGAVK